MPRYAAFLRGVMPTNCRMADLRAAFAQAGFTDVATVRGSGNVVFSAHLAPERKLARAAEAAMLDHLGKSFLTIVRSIDELRGLLASDPFARFRLKPSTKRVVTFLRDRPKGKLDLPIALGGARILAIDGDEVFTTYVRGKRAADFMVLLEKTFGKEQTTRTWETIELVAR